MSTAVDWGDLPTWLSAVAALSALAFAAVAVVVARRSLRIESRRDQVAVEASRRAQAILVSAWCDELGLRVRNASHSPVYQARLTVVDLAEPEAAPLHHVRADVLPPGAEATSHPAAVPGTAEPRVLVTFTDAAGVRWHRDAYGRLRELESRLTIAGAERMEAVHQHFSADLAARYGIALTCHTPDWPTRWQGYVRAGLDGTIADVLDAPNDTIAVLAEQRVIEPVVLAADQLDRFLPWTLQALTYQNRLYGVPLTAQVPVLISNLDLAPDAPATFEAIDDFAVQREPFHLLAIFAAAGGEIFGVGPDGTPDPNRFRGAAPTSIAAFESLAAVRPLRRRLDENGARQEFLGGRTPHLIGLAEDLMDARAAGLRCAVSAIPPFRNRNATRPYASVRGFLLSRRGANRLIARDLIPDYLARVDVARNQTAQLCMPSCLRDFQPGDRDLDVLRGGPDHSVPLPSHPRMLLIWRLLGETLNAILEGADPSASARRLDQRLGHVLGSAT
ncbi:sugar ABC transporter substrate-binding protein [Actinoplanes subtropicus]|uniref:sugar ABC transporter substrate-binding protein n=1 Tax=Actinoplanes subtropicus TaxID=543632 RepID=UPI0004C30BAF|nr:extracellular solute-binding protein [Actinoplanes subtropicus]